MKEPRDTGERITDEGERLVVDTDGRFAAVTVVERAKAKGWSSVTITEGSPELKRAVWLEGSMQNLVVSGYQPTLADESLLERLKRQRRAGPGETIMLRAEQVAADYVRRVIPVLYRSYDTLNTQRRKQAIRANETGQETGNSRGGSIAARELENRLNNSKQALNKAIEAADYFLGLGGKEIRVRETFEDGISRFVSDDLNQRQRIVRDLGQSTWRKR